MSEEPGAAVTTSSPESAATSHAAPTSRAAATPSPAALSPVEPAHAHAWAGMRFELVDGHAWVIESCAACGTVRRYRAFERFWDPAAQDPTRQD